MKQAPPAFSDANKCVRSLSLRPTDYVSCACLADLELISPSLSTSHDKTHLRNS